MRVTIFAIVLSAVTFLAGRNCIGADLPPSATSASTPKTYRNPLMPDRVLADPDVIRVDGKYYLYPTSSSRGYEVFVSDDLVHWEAKGLAFDDARRGDWAPDVFYNQRGDKKFYLYYTDNMTAGRNEGINKQVGVAVADSPLGPFTDNGPLVSVAIDANLFQDDDGSYYLYYVDLNAGFKIMAQPMADPVTKKGEPTMAIRPTQPWEKVSGEVTEGPFMLKHNEICYLMYSGTGADSPNYGIGY